MMYPRLVLARRLLQSGGACFVSIDDHELHTLRMIMDEIFGAGCFRNCIIFGRGQKSVQAQFPTVDSLGVGHEYVVMYARDPDARFTKLELPRDAEKAGTWNNHWRGTDRPTMRYPLFGIRPERGQWRWSEERSRNAAACYERMLRELAEDASTVTQTQIDAWYRRECARTGQAPALLRLSARGKPEHYVPPATSRIASDVWLDLPTRGSGEIRALFGSPVFDNPKPIGLIRRILAFTTSPQRGDIILDFFAGSCSTAAAVMEQNSDDGGDRRFIMVQTPEPVDASRDTGRNALAAGLPTIAAIGRERIQRMAARIAGKATAYPQIRYITLAADDGEDTVGSG
jgi:adenine-specific DNA-methyltransferase